MKTTLIVALATMAILVAGACAPAATPVTIAPSQPTGISVSGEGSVTVKPTLAQVTLGIQLTTPLTSTVWQQASDKMNAVVAKLRELGIEEKDIKTTRITANTFEPTNQPIRFQVGNMVTVKVRDLNKLSSVLDGAMAAGANRIENLFFTVDDPHLPLQQAREAAMADAKAKAEQLAKLAGVKVGKPLRIEEDGGRTSYPGGGMGMGGGGTPVSPGETEVRVSVGVAYAIE